MRYKDYIVVGKVEDRTNGTLIEKGTRFRPLFRNDLNQQANLDAIYVDGNIDIKNSRATLVKLKYILQNVSLFKDTE